jgi:hypothetical protein
MAKAAERVIGNPMLKHGVNNVQEKEGFSPTEILKQI